MIVALMKMLRQPAAHVDKKPGGIPSKEPKDLDPMVLQLPLVIRSDSKTVLDWINGHAKQKRQLQLWVLPTNS